MQLYVCLRHGWLRARNGRVRNDDKRDSDRIVLFRNSFSLVYLHGNKRMGIYEAEADSDGGPRSSDVLEG